MPLDLEAKKVLLRKIPHGLFICTVREGDVINGFTASWVTQGSFAPPLVVMAVRSDGSSHAIIKRTNNFCLNVLRSDQKDLAAVFFKPQEGLGGRFESTTYQFGELGLPVLEDAIGGLECSVVGAVEHGDHSVFVAEVVSAKLIKDSESLNLSSTGWSYGG
ncbi:MULTISPECIES: flavin reductase family protein [Prochlorococcus]|uniref:DIM6/NTAB family protein n=1 Tax=Prochlorococcus marinus (strain SARG / CCMP1375 / SS120) TaxID=167539 RepID=Q7VBY9_PROMA|nr:MULTISPECIES: flavin reductase family protein [Prochlorococcus]AAP99997.1 DIM6/NTAB family protein [Prochlorococcus marinus subsp. marinus str. CCMP1375]KGG13795.1 DIM6/NTAB family protein [Prochlorococcus marinus str. LG]KGG18930.1 DIM6/NTAB family protein [Prochlorococcus marinus str. SS2]KGG23532.1 DIM6/NTAB family protein [Prochlorococcus marinus str. SS35]KGG32232.1 DIM6/NTAB family protein [Prochlorococcus marinus str. SS51]